MKKLTMVQVLQQAYRETRWDDVTAWMKESGANAAVSLQSATSVLLRDKKMGFLVMVPLAIYLRLPLGQIIQIAKECGDVCIHTLFQKSVTRRKRIGF
jgi:predicted pyridoxine 5'-phosphate oxidase superfamily flavin-nucleotide-binding protein